MEGVGLLLAALSCLATVSCALARDGIILAIDEAFAVARPVLSDLLAGDARIGGGKAYRPLSLAEGLTRALDAASAARERRGKTSVMVASPLVASALMGGASWAGDPALVVAEWHGPEAANLRTASSDPLPAYTNAGAACGAFIAALAASGGSPVCGILYSPAPTRPKSAMEAFRGAFELSAMGSALIIKELAVTGNEPSDDASAEAAVSEMLGSDIRVVFIALGSATPAALRAAQRPGIALGADYPLPETPRILSFRISPDEKAMAAALRSLASDAISGSPGTAAKIAVPSVLRDLPAAKAHSAGGRELDAYIREALRRASHAKG